MQEVKRKSCSATIYKSQKNLFTSTNLVTCNVCGKGITEGHSITAKTLPSGIVLFCNTHYPTDKKY